MRALRPAAIAAGLLTLAATLTPSTPADATIRCNPFADNAIVGTWGPDTLVGTDGDDIIIALGGDDVIDSGAGDDVICAGFGDDTITSTSGDNWIDAGFGDDTITTGDGADWIHGRGNSDVIDSGDGNDRVYGGSGADTLTTGDGDDIVNGGINPDTIDAGDGDDIVRGSSGADVLRAGAGDDKVYGGFGSDVCVDAETTYSCETIETTPVDPPDEDYVLDLGDVDVPGAGTVSMEITATEQLHINDVTIERNELLEAQLVGTAAGPVFDFELRTGAPGFDTAVVTLPYDEALLDGAPEEGLVIGTLDESINRWVPVDAVQTVDTDANTVTTTLEHFSAYTVLRYPDMTNAINALRDRGIMEQIAEAQASDGLSCPVTFARNYNQALARWNPVVEEGAQDAQLRDLGSPYAIVDGIVGSATNGDGFDFPGYFEGMIQYPHDTTDLFANHDEWSLSVWIDPDTVDSLVLFNGINVEFAYDTPEGTGQLFVGSNFNGTLIEDHFLYDTGEPVNVLVTRSDTGLIVLYIDGEEKAALDTDPADGWGYHLEGRTAVFVQSDPDASLDGEADWDEFTFFDRVLPSGAVSAVAETTYRAADQIVETRPDAFWTFDDPNNIGVNRMAGSPDLDLVEYSVVDALIPGDPAGFAVQLDQLAVDLDPNGVYDWIPGGAHDLTLSTWVRSEGYQESFAGGEATYGFDGNLEVTLSPMWDEYADGYTRGDAVVTVSALTEDGSMVSATYDLGPWPAFHSGFNVVVRRAQQDVQVFVDGEELGTLDLGGLPQWSNREFTVNGELVLDNLAYYEKALSQTKIDIIAGGVEGTVNVVDFDEDGITNCEELAGLIVPDFTRINPDTQQRGYDIPDLPTAVWQLDPTDPDVDNDGLLDGEELVRHNVDTTNLINEGERLALQANGVRWVYTFDTSPVLSDSDGDGISDAGDSGLLEGFALALALPPQQVWTECAADGYRTLWAVGEWICNQDSVMEFSTDTRVALAGMTRFLGETAYSVGELAGYSINGVVHWTTDSADAYDDFVRGMDILASETVNTYEDGGGGFAGATDVINTVNPYYYATLTGQDFVNALEAGDPELAGFSAGSIVFEFSTLGVGASRIRSLAPDQTVTRVEDISRLTSYRIPNEDLHAVLNTVPEIRQFPVGTTMVSDVLERRVDKIFEGHGTVEVIHTDNGWRLDNGAEDPRPGVLVLLRNADGTTNENVFSFVARDPNNPDLLLSAWAYNAVDQTSGGATAMRALALDEAGIRPGMTLQVDNILNKPTNELLDAGGRFEDTLLGRLNIGAVRALGYDVTNVSGLQFKPNGDRFVTMEIVEAN